MEMKRAKWMLWIVVAGLFMSGVTIWPAIFELETLIGILWGDAEPTGALHRFLVLVVDSLHATKADYHFLWYAGDWLAFAHIVLAILFAGAARDPVRNKWIVQCGLIMCALIPLLAGICIPIRGLPIFWFFVDSAFAPAAAIPLLIVLHDIRKVEQVQQSDC